LGGLLLGGDWLGEDGLEEVVDAAGEVNPGGGHETEAVAAGGGEGVVLAGVSGVGLDPLGGEHGFGLEAVEDGVDGALGEDELGVLLEETDDLEAVEATVPEGGEGGHLERSLAELGFPWASATAEGLSFADGGSLSFADGGSLSFADGGSLQGEIAGFELTAGHALYLG
jgi:hypothetical protein